MFVFEYMICLCHDQQKFGINVVDLWISTYDNGHFIYVSNNLEKNV